MKLRKGSRAPLLSLPRLLYGRAASLIAYGAAFALPRAYRHRPFRCYDPRGNPSPGEEVRDAPHVDNRGCGGRSGIAPAAAPLSPRGPHLYGIPTLPLLHNGQGLRGETHQAAELRSA